LEVGFPLKDKISRVTALDVLQTPNENANVILLCAPLMNPQDETVHLWRWITKNRHCVGLFA